MAALPWFCTEASSLKKKSSESSSKSNSNFFGISSILFKFSTIEATNHRYVAVTEFFMFLQSIFVP